MNKKREGKAPAKPREGKAPAAPVLGATPAKPNTGARYPDSIWAEIERLYIEEEINHKALSKNYQGKPSVNAIRSRATQRDKTGKTWKDKRLEYQQARALQIAPQNLALDIMRRIQSVLANQNMTDAQVADSLYKLQSMMEKLLEPGKNLPTMYWVLEDLTKFIRIEYPDFLTKHKFLDVVRDYENHARAKALGEF